MQVHRVGAMMDARSAPRPTMTFAPRSLFLGHGAPTLALSKHPGADALRALGARLSKPEAVVVVSPHRQDASFAAGIAPRFQAWHDFRGFPRDLYALRYEPAGAPALAQRVAEQVRDAGLAAAVSDDARIDHGIWVPLRLMWPEADVAVVPLSQTEQGPATHLALGRALRPLTDEGVLVIGSGSITHNLGDLDFHDEQAPVQPWAREFDDWIAEHLTQPERLVRYRELAPHARHAHPSEEHLLPLFVAVGAGGAPTALFRGFSHGSVSLSAYAFGPD
jgi:4,5-DOPA dioxygenase extradiol